MRGRLSVASGRPSPRHRFRHSRLYWRACGECCRAGGEPPPYWHGACFRYNLRMAANGRSTLGRSYRSYRFPQRKGGRLSRRPGSASRLGPLAGGISAFFLAMLAMGGVATAAMISYFTADLPAAHDLATVPVSLTTRIYDRSGEHLLYTLEDERRELVGLDSVPQKMQEATIAIEDKTFWTNPGVDVGGIIRAMNANAASGAITQGGSTITQQLIKTRLLSDEPTLTRKIKEAILALEATRVVQQEADPRDVPESDLLREPGLRHPRRLEDVLRPARSCEAHARADGDARRSRTAPVRLRPGAKPGRGDGATRGRAHRDGGEQLHHRRRGSGGEGRAHRREAGLDVALRGPLHLPRPRAAHPRAGREGRLPRWLRGLHDP